MKRKTGVNYVNTDYVVREDQKQVICVLNFYVKFPEKIESFISEIYYNPNTDFKEFIKLNNLDFVLDDYTNTFRIYGTVYGYADCQESDEFDHVLGKKISQTRAQEKAFIVANKIYIKLSNIVESILSDMSKIGFNCAKSSQKCNNHVNELIVEKYGEIV